MGGAWSVSLKEHLSFLAEGGFGLAPLGGTVARNGSPGALTGLIGPDWALAIGSMAVSGGDFLQKYPWPDSRETPKVEG